MKPVTSADKTPASLVGTPLTTSNSTFILVAYTQLTLLLALRNYQRIFVRYVAAAILDPHNTNYIFGRDNDIAITQTQ